MPVQRLPVRPAQPLQRLPPVRRGLPARANQAPARRVKTTRCISRNLRHPPIPAPSPPACQYPRIPLPTRSTPPLPTRPPPHKQPKALDCCQHYSSSCARSAPTRPPNQPLLTRPLSQHAPSQFSNFKSSPPAAGSGLLGQSQLSLRTEYAYPPSHNKPSLPAPLPTSSSIQLPCPIPSIPSIPSIRSMSATRRSDKQTGQAAKLEAASQWQELCHQVPQMSR